MSILRMKYSLNLLEIEKRLGLLCIFFLPIDSLRIVFLPGNVSIFRICSITYFIIYLLFFFRKIKKNKINFLLFLYLFSCCLAFILSKNKDLSISIFINDIFSFLFVFISYEIYDKNDIPTLLKYIVLSMIFPVFFSLIEYFNFYVLGSRITSISLFGILQSTVDAGDIAIQQISGIPRLVFPYSISPIFAFNIGAGIISLLLLDYYNQGIKVQRLILFVLNLLMILSFSRSGIIALIIIYGIYFIKFKNVSGLQLFVCIFSILLILFIILNWEKLVEVLDKNKIFHVLIGRIYETSINSISEDRHFLLILEGFHITFESISNLLFGTGSQSMILMDGKYTFIPYSFLSSHITILVERGLLGYIATYSCYYYLLLQRKFFNSPLWLFTIYIVISLLFYEIRSSLIIPVIMSICFLMKKDSKNVLT